MLGIILGVMFIKIKKPGRVPDSCSFPFLHSFSLSCCLKSTLLLNSSMSLSNVVTYWSLFLYLGHLYAMICVERLSGSDSFPSGDSDLESDDISMYPEEVRTSFFSVQGWGGLEEERDS